MLNGCVRCCASLVCSVKRVLVAGGLFVALQMSIMLQRVWMGRHGGREMVELTIRGGKQTTSEIELSSSLKGGNGSLCAWACGDGRHAIMSGVGKMDDGWFTRSLREGIGGKAAHPPGRGGGGQAAAHEQFGKRLAKN